MQSEKKKRTSGPAHPLIGRSIKVGQPGPGSLFTLKPKQNVEITIEFQLSSFGVDSKSNLSPNRKSSIKLNDTQSSRTSDLSAISDLKSEFCGILSVLYSNGEVQVWKKLWIVKLQTKGGFTFLKAFSTLLPYFNDFLGGIQ